MHRHLLRNLNAASSLYRVKRLSPLSSHLLGQQLTHKFHTRPVVARASQIEGRTIRVTRSTSDGGSSSTSHTSVVRVSDDGDDVRSSHTSDRYKILSEESSLFNYSVVVTESVELDGCLYRNLSFGGTPADSLLQGRVRIVETNSGKEGETEENGKAFGGGVNVGGSGLKTRETMFDFTGRCAYIDTMASAGISFMNVLLPKSLLDRDDHGRSYRALCVGLGVGSLPNWLSSTFPDMSIDIVEIDPVVVRASVNYFGLPSGKVNIYKKDVQLYLDEQSDASLNKHSLIYLDIFNEHGLPKSVFNQEFVHRLRNQLRRNGVLVANIFCNIKLFNQILCLFERAFKSVHILAVEENRNNIILVAYNREAVTAEELMETGRKLAQHHTFDFDFAKVLQFALAEGSYGWESSTTESPS